MYFGSGKQVFRMAWRSICLYTTRARLLLRYRAPSCALEHIYVIMLNVSLKDAKIKAWWHDGLNSACFSLRRNGIFRNKIVCFFAVYFQQFLLIGSRRKFVWSKIVCGFDFLWTFLFFFLSRLFFFSSRTGELVLSNLTSIR